MTALIESNAGILSSLRVDERMTCPKKDTTYQVRVKVIELAEN